MITFAEALSRLLAQARPVEGLETVPLLYSSRRVLAEDIVSPIAVPGWDNSQMDGYAVRAADIAGATPEKPVVLPVSDRIPAGNVGGTLKAGSAARIFTGAPMPEGADTVVPQEDCEAVPEGVKFTKPLREGSWVRRRGSDIEQGSVVLRKGDRLQPAAVGMCASIGRAYVKVYRRLRVGIFFTGNELVQPGQPLPPGGIYNSNRFMIRSLLQELGCEALDLGNIPDNLDATIKAFESAAAEADVILTSGGMSVGEEDHVKPAVEALGKLEVWRIRLKPGKPFAFGEVRGVPFIGCPGNPVASFVVFLMMARPYLLRTMGLTDIDVKPIAVRADFDWLKPGDRQEFVRVRRNASGGLDLYHTQNSQVLSSCAWADGLVDIPIGGTVHRGDMVSYYPFCQFFA
jgi:molybdopterin molybdotransferase